MENTAIETQNSREILNVRKGKFDWELIWQRANWTRSINYIHVEIEVKVDLAPLEGAAWSWHAAHVARHHPAVVAAAREHRALVPGVVVTTMRGRRRIWKVSLANTSPEAAIHARVKRDLVTGPLLSFNVVPEVRVILTWYILMGVVILFEREKLLILCILVPLDYLCCLILEP